MIVDLEYSYGKSHSAFFITAGYSGLLTFFTMYFSSTYWQTVYNETSVKCYALIVLTGAVLSLFVFERVNKIFSFKSQIIYFQILISLSALALFLIGEYTMKTKEDLSSPFRFKNIIFAIISGLQGVFIMPFLVS